MNKQDTKNDTCNSRTTLIQFHKGKKARKLTAFWFLSLQQEDSKHSFDSKHVHGIPSQATNKNKNVKQVTTSATKERKRMICSHRPQASTKLRKGRKSCIKEFRSLIKIVSNQDWEKPVITWEHLYCWVNKRDPEKSNVSENQIHELNCRGFQRWCR